MPRVIDDQGELLEATDQVLMQRIIDLEQELADAEKDLRHKRRRIAALEAEKQKARDEAPERQMVENIFVEWQQVSGKSRSKLTPDRFDAIVTRVRDGYSRNDFSLAIAGGCYDPFVTEAKNGKRIKHNDIELICRDGKRFEAAANKAPAQKRESNDDEAEQT